jgi:uncharacterized protein (TIGR02996 family)
MDEHAYLRLLRAEPDNDEVRLAYWDWLEETGDERTPYVRLMRQRLRLQEELQNTERLIWDHELRMDAEWIDIAFPMRIRSPMVGRCYTRPAPEAAPFVALGGTVTSDTVVCLIEALKIFNEIKAGVHGVVSEISVADGDRVEFNQVLFRVRRPSSDWW